MKDYKIEKKRLSFKKLTNYLEEIVWRNEDYVRQLSDKNSYIAGEAVGCRNTAKDILDYIKTGRFNLDLDATEALRTGKWINRKVAEVEKFND